MSRAMEGRTAVDGVLDGLEYLVAEALRMRRTDMAEELVRALHAIADQEERRVLQSRIAPLRLVHVADEAVGEAGPGNVGAGNIVHIHGRGHPAQGLYHCLEQLQVEAEAFGMPFLAHLIGVACEAAQMEAEAAAGDS